MTTPRDGPPTLVCALDAGAGQLNTAVSALEERGLLVSFVFVPGRPTGHAYFETDDTPAAAAALRALGLEPRILDAGAGRRHPATLDRLAFRFSASAREIEELVARTRRRAR